MVTTRNFHPHRDSSSVIWNIIREIPWRLSPWCITINVRCGHFSTHVEVCFINNECLCQHPVRSSNQLLAECHSAFWIPFLKAMSKLYSVWMPVQVHTSNTMKVDLLMFTTGLEREIMSGYCSRALLTASMLAYDLSSSSSTTKCLRLSVSHHTMLVKLFDIVCNCSFGCGLWCIRKSLY